MGLDFKTLDEVPQEVPGLGGVPQEVPGLGEVLWKSLD